MSVESSSKTSHLDEDVQNRADITINNRCVGSIQLCVNEQAHTNKMRRTRDTAPTVHNSDHTHLVLYSRAGWA